MADAKLVEQLDRAVEAVLAGPRAPRPRVASEVAELLRLAEDLRFMPGERFRENLKTELMQAASERKENTMTAATTTDPIRKGFHTVTPYPVVENAARLMDFLKQAFGAEERLRIPTPQGKIMHAEAQIGDSIIEFADAGSEWKPMPGAFHLYVRDVDATYQRAVEAGAATLRPPTDQPYGDREADIRDPVGNQWYIATHTAGKPGQFAPEGLRSITPYLHPPGADNYIDFLARAFGAKPIDRYAAPDGRVMHAKVRIGDSFIEMGEPQGEWQPMPTATHLYVEDVDAVYRAALEAGATSLMEPKDQPYGDRSGGVADPFGNYWFIATHIRDVAF